jgi:hypothetical protein
VDARPVARALWPRRRAYRQQIGSSRSHSGGSTSRTPGSAPRTGDRRPADEHHTADTAQLASRSRNHTVGSARLARRTGLERLSSADRGQGPWGYARRSGDSTCARALHSRRRTGSVADWASHTLGRWAACESDPRSGHLAEKIGYRRRDWCAHWLPGIWWAWVRSDLLDDYGRVGGLEAHTYQRLALVVSL